VPWSRRPAAMPSGLPGRHPEPAAEPGSSARLAELLVVRAAGPRAALAEARLPAELLQAEVLQVDRCAEPAELPRAAERGARLPVAEPVVGELAAPSSAARAPFHAPAPAVARSVRPEASALPAPELRPVAAYGAQPLAAAAAVLPDAEAAGAVVPPDAAVGEAAARQDAAAGVAEVVPGVAAAAVPHPAARAGLPSAPPLAAASASRQDRVLPWPVPRRSAPIVRAMERTPVAWPSTRSWQAG